MVETSWTYSNASLFQTLGFKVGSQKDWSDCNCTFMPSMQSSTDVPIGPGMN